MRTGPGTCLTFLALGFTLMTALIAGCGGDDDEGAGGADGSSVGSEQAIVVPQYCDIRDADDLSGRTVVVAKAPPARST